ncbi:hypothetical protein SAMN05660653_00379 [Desulfonatronum thiosulfatophilum]|uniref:Uncharacterized protein n=1 Tax=Desulfonatronum thiosulfatophilum TaxID=617002 RepID=A0A1G6AJB6_9BACT|nr:hypothetical protein SAMN05660653_00379 [Desulfonatronum thiosulfatophilum]
MFKEYVEDTYLFSTPCEPGLGPACLDFAVSHCLTEPGFVHRTIAGLLKHKMLFIHAMVRCYEAGEGVCEAAKSRQAGHWLSSYEDTAYNCSKTRGNHGLDARSPSARGQASRACRALASVLIESSPTKAGIQEARECSYRPDVIEQMPRLVSSNAVKQMSEQTSPQWPFCHCLPETGFRFR